MLKKLILVIAILALSSHAQRVCQSRWNSNGSSSFVIPGFTPSSGITYYIDDHVLAFGGTSGFSCLNSCDLEAGPHEFKGLDSNEAVEPNSEADCILPLVLNDPGLPPLKRAGG